MPMRLTAVCGGAVSLLNGTYEFTPSKGRQRLIFNLKNKMLLDGSNFLELDIHGKSARAPFVSIGPDGQFLPGERLILPTSGHFRVPLFQFGEAPWLVNFRKPADLNRIPRSPGRRLLFITSPAIYDRYMVLDRARFKGKDLARVVERQDFYRKLLSSVAPMKRISEGRGHTMEVYDLAPLLERGAGSAETPATSASSGRIWFEPAALAACVKNAEVIVHWDVSHLPGVRTVEVKTVRGGGEEGLFARAGPIGSKETGRWMHAGREILLRNAESGSVLGRAKLKPLPCGLP